MTAGQAVRELAAHPGLLASLMAAVRPEFRADELVFGPQNPVFGGKPCLVTGCGRTAGGPGLCRGHRRRWTEAGRPEVTEFAAAADPGWRGKDALLACCAAPGCHYGVGQRKDLCVRHALARERVGTPGLQGWLDGLPASPPGVPSADCLIGTCRLWAEPASDWCRSHGMTWKRRGRPPAAEFARAWATGVTVPGYERRIRLDGLPAHLKLEIWRCSTRCSAAAMSAPRRPRPSS